MIMEEKEEADMAAVWKWGDWCMFLQWR
jgi:hypothetical protein